MKSFLSLSTLLLGFFLASFFINNECEGILSLSNPDSTKIPPVMKDKRLTGASYASNIKKRNVLEHICKIASKIDCGEYTGSRQITSTN